MLRTHGHGLLGNEKGGGRGFGDEGKALPDAERALEAAVGDDEAILDSPADFRGQIGGEDEGRRHRPQHFGVHSSGGGYLKM